MHPMTAFFIFLAVGCSVLNAAEALYLDFHTDPPVELIKPNVDTTKLSLRLEDAAGRTVAEPTRFSIELDSPPGNAFFSTGFPIVEGTPLLRGEFNSDSGNLELQYLFPIRGIYRLKVVAESSLGRSEHEWDLKIQEEPRAVRRFFGLMSLLSVFGGVSGICLARSVRRRTAGPVTASVITALVLFAGLSSNTVAGEEHAHSHAADIKTSDNAIVESSSGRMEIRLSPPSATVGSLATLSDGIEAILDEACLRAGQPNRLNTCFRELGGLVRIAGDLAVQDGSRLVHGDHVRGARTYALTLEEQHLRQSQTIETLAETSAIAGF